MKKAKHLCLFLKCCADGDMNSLGKMKINVEYRLLKKEYCKSYLTGGSRQYEDKSQLQWVHPLFEESLNDLLMHNQ